MNDVFDAWLIGGLCFSVAGDRFDLGDKRGAALLCFSGALCFVTAILRWLAL